MACSRSPAWSSAVRPAGRSAGHGQGHGASTPRAAGRRREGHDRADRRHGRKFETKTDKKGEFIQIGLQSAATRSPREKDKLGTATANTRVSQRGPAERAARHRRRRAATIRRLAAKTAELQKAFDEGVALSNAGKHDEAIEKFNKALAVNPNCHDCYNNIGFSYAQKKDYDKAEADYKKAIEVKPD